MINKTNALSRPAAFFGCLFSVGALIGCQAKPAVSTPAAIQSLANKTKEQLVLVQGGEFQMGDFGEIHNSEKLPYSGERHDGPIHSVSLSTYSISKHKVTLGDYDVYTGANNLPLTYSGSNARASDIKNRAHPKSASFPVGVDWEDAQNYCRWIGTQIGKKMDLPTEAEWEYAARARGTFLVYPTDNGKAEPGRNFPSLDETEAVSGDTTGDMPVGMYPPTALGLHDLGHNGFEWTSDWYAEDYYGRSPAKDPRGPEAGIKKVIRGLSPGESKPAMTFERSSREPQLANSRGNVTNRSYGFRCVAR